VVVNGLAPEVLFRLDAANRRYPAGLDTWLVDPLGRIVGLPRSVRLDIGAIVGGA
jgi:alpha-D-ribose 1-methylphosphonate 5-triphosphate synthase subunit PhnH